MTLKQRPEERFDSMLFEFFHKIYIALFLILRIFYLSSFSSVLLQQTFLLATVKCNVDQ